MILMDSSGWVEIVADGPRREAFVEALERADEVVVPTIVVREVYRAVEAKAGREKADAVARYLSTLRIVPLDLEIAISAARAASELHMHLADSIIQATADVTGARIVTGDADFSKLPNVEFIPLKW